MLVTWGFVRPLTQCLHNAIVTAISCNCNCGCSCHATMVSPTIARIKQDYFVRFSVRLSHWLYKLKPLTSTSLTTWHLECGRNFEVNLNCKKYCSLVNTPQRIWKEGTVEHRTLLYISCTSVVQCEPTVVLRSVELRDFRLRNVIRGNLWNVPHLIFCKLPCDNFLHSSIREIPVPHTAAVCNTASCVRHTVAVCNVPCAWFTKWLFTQLALWIDTHFRDLSVPF